jgi:hypothetical protein
MVYWFLDCWFLVDSEAQVIWAPWVLDSAVEGFAQVGWFALTGCLAVKAAFAPAQYLETQEFWGHLLAGLVCWPAEVVC